MKLQIPKLISLVMFLGILVMSCSKSDPAPLKAQVNAAILAGDKGKSKGWKIATITIAQGTQTSNIALNSCQTDNIYTFTNNDAQSYTGDEGSSKCDSTQPQIMESGTWAFTLDGLTLIVSVDDTFSYWGLFSPEAYLYHDSATPPNYSAFPIGYPYPAFVQTLTTSNMVLVMTNNYFGTIYTYTLTFIAV